MVVLDTNIIIDHLRQNSSEETVLMELVEVFGQEALHISVITLQELYTGSSTRDAEALQILHSVLAPIKILSYDTQIAELAGSISRDLKNSIGFADSAIAAGCIFNGMQLVTLNAKHFRDISQLELYNLFA